MADAMKTGSVPPSPHMEHAIDRFREVHRDYQLEFNRTRVRVCPIQ